MSQKGFSEQSQNPLGFDEGLLQQGPETEDPSSQCCCSQDREIQIQMLFWFEMNLSLCVLRPFPIRWNILSAQGRMTLCMKDDRITFHQFIRFIVHTWFYRGIQKRNVKSSVSYSIVLYSLI